jgi:RNA polymerase sigma factor (sigma-70 family)
LANDDESPTLAALYVRNREVMLRAARAVLRNQHDAEDAVSAAVLNVAARLSQGHVMNDPDAYLVQSARNAALDQVRRSSRRREQWLVTGDTGGNEAGPSGVEPLADVPASTDDVVDQIIARERGADIQVAVRQTLQRLAEREAAMLSLLLAGTSRVEIGARFNLTGQRVGQLLKKPISDLLKELGLDPETRRPQRTPEAGR